MILNKTEDHSGGKRENLKIKFLNDESLHNSGNNVHGWLAHDDAFQTKIRKPHQNQLLTVNQFPGDEETISVSSNQTSKHDK